MCRYNGVVGVQMESHNLAVLSSWLFEDSSDIKLQDSPQFPSKQIRGMSACQDGRSVKAFGRSKQHDSHQSR